MKTDAAGKFSYTFTVPESKETEHTITVTDGSGNKATWGLKMENEPPPQSETLTPKDDRFGWFGAEEVTFNWKEVDDASGVTYTVVGWQQFKVFSPGAGMRKTDLRTDDNMHIQPGTYYWR